MFSRKADYLLNSRRRFRSIHLRPEGSDASSQVVISVSAFGDRSFIQRQTPQSDRSRHIVAEGFRQPLRCVFEIKGLCFWVVGFGCLVVFGVVGLGGVCCGGGVRVVLGCLCLRVW